MDCINGTTAELGGKGDCEVNFRQFPNDDGLEWQLGISRSAVNALVADFVPRRLLLEWGDLLGSVTIGYACFILAATRWAPTLPIAICLLYRASIFTHELAHIPIRTHRAFRFAWNVLCGVPLLIPSFLYEIHMEHHHPLTYGSAHDGEYLPFTRLAGTRAIAFMLSSILVAPALVTRFLLLAPLSWIVRPLRLPVLERASAMVIDPEYRRPLPPGGPPKRWVVQEAACFAWCVLVVLLVASGHVSSSVLLFAYVTITAVAAVNFVRVLVAHRYQGNRSTMSFEEQVLDSNTFPCGFAAVWAPLGLRYHAVHHLLPHLPYHGLRKAHDRIMARLPVTSALRNTERTSLIAALRELLFARQADEEGSS